MRQVVGFSGRKFLLEKDFAPNMGASFSISCHNFTLHHANLALSYTKLTVNHDNFELHRANLGSERLSNSTP